MGTTTFVWDPVFDCVSHELDENNDVKAVYHNEPQQYGGVLSQRRGSTSHYHHYDALGSTRFLTDSSGNVTDTYLHDAWGNLVASTGTTVNPFKWVGKYGYYTDDGTGQVYVRARMYQPIVARWSSVDPRWQDDNCTPYTFVRQHPIQSHDFDGHRCTRAEYDQVKYLPDRGIFRSVKMTTNTETTPHAIFGTIPFAAFFSELVFDFKPSAGFVLDASKFNSDCCCCKTLGVVQIVKQSIGYKGILPTHVPFYRSHDWEIDAGICGFPYSPSSTGSPCHLIDDPVAGKITSGSVPFSDTPAVGFPSFAGYLTNVTQDFEACIVCIQPHSEYMGHDRNDEGFLGGATGRVLGAVSYGCIRWGHSWEYTGRDKHGPTWCWRRYIGNRSWQGKNEFGGTRKSDFEQGSLVEPGVAPSPEFQKTLLAYRSINSQGCTLSDVIGR